MFVQRIKTAGLILAAGIGLAACTDGYGYGGVSAGYGSAGYYDDYYDPYYGGYYNSGYTPYWGWYGDYYYPGTGYYVYDRYRRPHRWNQAQQRYWQARRSGWHGDRPRNQWRGFEHHEGRGDSGRQHDWRQHDGRGHDWRGSNGNGGNWRGGDGGPPRSGNYHRRNAAGEFRARHEGRRPDRSHRP